MGWRDHERYPQCSKKQESYTVFLPVESLSHTKWLHDDDKVSSWMPNSPLNNVYTGAPGSVG